MGGVSRREMLATGGLLTGGAVLGLGPAAGGAEVTPDGSTTKLKVVVAGGHPDDPETGCGGTMALYADRGYEVVSLYLTRGERGISGKSLDEAARIRTAEVSKACRILKARSAFAGQIDGATEVTPKRYDEFREIIAREKPDVLFTHWPVDTHRDHRAASFLAYDAWLSLGKTFELYYFEVSTGAQTQQFAPTHFVDITATEPRKKAATMAHASQKPVGMYARHEAMSRFRGMEYGVTHAEGFVRHARGPGGFIPE